MTIFKPGNCTFLLLICASTGEVSFLFIDVIQIIMFFILLGLANSIFMDLCTAFECVVYTMCFVLGPLLNGICDTFLVFAVFSCLLVLLLLQAVHARHDYTLSILLIGLTLCGHLPEQALCACAIVTSCQLFIPKLGPTWQSLVLLWAMSCATCFRFMFKSKYFT